MECAHSPVIHDDRGRFATQDDDRARSSRCCLLFVQALEPGAKLGILDEIRAVTELIHASDERPSQNPPRRRITNLGDDRVGKTIQRNDAKRPIEK